MKFIRASMGSLYYVRKARNFLNKSLFKIYRNKYGNFVNAEHKISSIVRKKFQNLKLANDNDEITIKLGGDGTQVGGAKKMCLKEGKCIYIDTYKGGKKYG